VNVENVDVNSKLLKFRLKCHKLLHIKMRMDNNKIKKIFKYPALQNGIRIQLIINILYKNQMFKKISNKVKIIIWIFRVNKI